jgi:hypothetical protein
MSIPTPGADPLGKRAVRLGMALAAGLLAQSLGAVDLEEIVPGEGLAGPFIERVVELRAGSACTPRRPFTLQGRWFGEAQGAREVRLSRPPNPRSREGIAAPVIDWTDTRIRVAYPEQLDQDRDGQRYVGIWTPAGRRLSNQVLVQFCPL